MPDLIIPAPVLDYKSKIPGVVISEDKLEVKSAPVKLPDGKEFDLEASGKGKAGFFIYRRYLPSSAVEVWDDNDKQKKWVPEAGAIPKDLKPTPYAFFPDKMPRWKGILVAAANKDQFRKTVGSYPRYFFRAYFETIVDKKPISGLSALSAEVKFVSITDASRAGIEVDEVKTPPDTDDVRLFLRDNNASRNYLGWVEIKKNTTILYK